MAKRLLVVLAHPDDETFICGGTLARYAAAGVQITLVCATKGEMGRRLGVPATATREALPVLREQELRDACQALGISDLRFLGLWDKTLDYYDPHDLAAQIVPFFHELGPDAVLTFHEKLGGHPDHCAIGRATRLAWEQAGRGARLYYLLWSSYKDQLPVVGATEAQVTAITVTGAGANAKLKAFHAHRTQSQLMAWLWKKGAAGKMAGTEYFLQGSGPARPGEKDLLL